MQRRRTVKNNNRSDWQKATLHVQHTFFVDFFAVVFHNSNFLVTLLMEKTSYVFLFTFFFTAVNFHIAFDWWPLAFLILSPPLQNFHVVLPTKKCLLFFYLSL